VDGQRTFFDFVDHVSQNIMLPLGGMLIALFAAWGLPKTVIGAQLGLQKDWVNIVWKVLCGVVAPLGVLAVFMAQWAPVRNLFAAVAS
jgi:NSS family neurotransmitter:Na+ symporter